jgi:hypothetical protein
MSEAPIVEQGLVTKLEVVINVKDKGNARRWYADKLGIHFDEDDRAFINGVTVVLWGFEDATPASHVSYQFITPNLERAHTMLKERGVEVSGINKHCWNFEFCDPEGNKFVFYSPWQWLASGMAPHDPAGFPGGMVQCGMVQEKAAAL